MVRWLGLYSGVAALLLLVSSAPAWADGITVFAAASLSHALQEVSARYEKETGVEVRHSFASSATLAIQISAGAPADIFISANTDWMDYLQGRGQINATSRRNLLGNRLVLVVPKGKSIGVKFEKGYDLAGAFEGRLCTGNVEAVPVGIYAKQALSYFGWWEGLQRRVVGTQDVRAALAFVERGECAAGIVYESDARMSGKVTIAGVFPDSSHEPIVYPMALITNTGNKSKGYWEYLQSPAGQTLFANHGFGMVK